MSTFPALWQSLLPIGRDPATGGYRRFCWSPAELDCRAWFETTAAERNLRPVTDRNGNLWAWWEPPEPQPARPAAIAVGSHLDSVPDGGAFDGPLGVVSAFAAVDELRATGFVPARPIAVAAFAEEEGGRFGVACLGSRLLTGAIDPEQARGLTDGDGITFGAAMQAAGHDPGGLGRDEELIGRLGTYVELHIEQGRALAELDIAIAVADGIWPHGRWRLDFTGQADHAGTAALAGRHDPMIPYAATVLAARQAAIEHGTLATVGRVVARPGAANAVCSSVTAWLDARAPDGEQLEETTDQILAAAGQEAAAHQVGLDYRPESFTPAVDFDADLRDRLVSSLLAAGIGAPVLATGAGHDAGILAARLPTGMLFVRNPTGVSHSPAEHADDTDCATGVAALAAVLRDLAGP